MSLHDYFFYAFTGAFIVAAAIVIMRLNALVGTLVSMRQDAGRIAEALERIEAKLPKQG